MKRENPSSIDFMKQLSQFHFKEKLVNNCLFLITTSHMYSIQIPKNINYAIHLLKSMKSHWNVLMKSIHTIF